MRAVIAAAALLCAALPAVAQSLRPRVDAVRDGTVRMSFPVREGVCGSGRNVNTRGSGRDSDDWIADCEPGPARVVIRRRAGATVEIDTYVGGRWRARDDVTDLGDVPAADAVELLLSIATTARGEAAKDAIFPVAIADVEVTPRLSALARDRNLDREVRQASIFWLGDVGGDGVLDLLAQLIDDDPDPEIRERAVFAVSRNVSPRAVRILRDIVENESYDTEVRERAVFWLGQTREGDAAEYLKDAFRRLRAESLRERILFSLSQQRNAESERWLADEVVLDGSVSMELRRKAVFWLGQMRSASERIIGLYDRVGSDELRERLIFAYSQRRGDERALEKLMEIARSDGSTELRRKAIFWLGQSKDPRAVRFLSELIG